MSYAPYLLEIESERERVFVRPSGEVDLSNASHLEETVGELLDRGFACVVIDLRRVTFLDSSGLRALVNVHHQARSLHARAKIILGGPSTRRVLEITGLLDYLDVEGR